MGRVTQVTRLFLLAGVLACIVFLMCSCSRVSDEGGAILPRDFDGTLLPFESDGKWGYVDTEGQVVIEPVYSYAGYFSEGMAVISDGELYGYINKRNQVVIPPRYSGASEFENGYAAVSTGDWQYGTALWGFIDKNGREVVRPQFLYAESFTREGRALVWVQHGDEIVKGFVDTGGRVFIPDDFEICSGFSDGLALVRKDELYGYIDAGYSMVIPPQFQYAGSFGDGVAYAEKDGGKYMIDKSGKIISHVAYAFSTFSDGLAVFSDGNLYGYIDKEGNIAIEARFAWAKDFCNGLAAVQERMEDGGKWGFINTSGETVIEAVYDEVEDFRHGYARAYVYSGAKYYILDKTGKIVYSGKYRIE